MTQCPECKSFKKASNCIRCYRSMKERYEILASDFKKVRGQIRRMKEQYESLVADLKDILTNIPYHRVAEEIKIRLENEESV